jgi:hypothetical protein
MFAYVNMPKVRANACVLVAAPLHSEASTSGALGSLNPITGWVLSGHKGGACWANEDCSSSR